MRAEPIVLCIIPCRLRPRRLRLSARPSRIRSVHRQRQRRYVNYCLDLATYYHCYYSYTSNITSATATTLAATLCEECCQVEEEPSKGVLWDFKFEDLSKTSCPNGRAVRPISSNGNIRTNH